MRCSAVFVVTVTSTRWTLESGSRFARLFSFDIGFPRLLVKDGVYERRPVTPWLARDWPRLSERSDQTQTSAVPPRARRAARRVDRRDVFALGLKVVERRTDEDSKTICHPSLPGSALE
jgi:hypothetical protein